MPRRTFVIDFFNVFSDYRETYYNRLGVDFHTVKYKTIIKDTCAFFELFFTEYVKVAGISPQDSEFIFVVKRIYNYDKCLGDIAKKYRHLSIKFILVNDRYKDSLIEQNKDDYLCQYLLAVYAGSILISNDKYNNRTQYITTFMDIQRINVQVIRENIDTNTFYIVNENITRRMLAIRFGRVSVPKKDFGVFHSTSALTALQSC